MTILYKSSILSRLFNLILSKIFTLFFFFVVLFGKLYMMNLSSSNEVNFDIIIFFVFMLYYRLWFA